MYNTPEVREVNGTSILVRATYTTEDYTEFNVATEVDNPEVVLTGITIRNLADFPSGADPRPILRVKLAAADTDASSVDVFPGRDSVYLRFVPSDQRRSVWLKAVNAEVLANLVPEYEVSP